MNKDTGSGAGAARLGISAAALPVSGLYEYQGDFFFHKEELRLDVDGLYPQNTASGAIHGVGLTQANWIAAVTNTGPNTWSGGIWYKNGPPSMLLWDQVSIQVSIGLTGPISATATFTSLAIPHQLVRTFQFRSPFFHLAEFEYDAASNTTAITSIDTDAHPNRPASLPVETLTLEEVYRRAGFDVTVTSGGGVVPLAGAGANARWSDFEMHDAMQTFWSRFGNVPQWSMWVFFAALHEAGTSLGGIMFDDIGPNHRQGTAIFNNAFISVPPAGDPAPAAWVQRMRFWTAAHEMGHAFNLAHSWQKSLGAPIVPGGPWIALMDEPEARSFMNYPYFVSGGQAAFFSNFEFRFSDQELLFMRHAPEQFVQMGNADWFDNHGFREARVPAEPTFRLEASVGQPSAEFEFMEPVVVELALTNQTDQPQIVPDTVLQSADSMTVVIKKPGKAARQFIPYADRCTRPKNLSLAPGQSVKDSLFVSAGKNGWDIAEPGYYTIQIALHLPGEDVVSNPLLLRVAPPKGYEESYVAQDFFSDDVGRVLTFDGSRVLTAANATLREVCERLSASRAAIHASVALAGALAREQKMLDPGRLGGPRLTSVAQAQGSIKVAKADPAEAEALARVLQKEPAKRSLGPTDYDYYTERFQTWLGSDVLRPRTKKAKV